jgi:hypothetical protein
VLAREKGRTPLPATENMFTSPIAGDKEKEQEKKRNQKDKTNKQISRSRFIYKWLGNGGYVQVLVVYKEGEGDNG